MAPVQETLCTLWCFGSGVFALLQAPCALPEDDVLAALAGTTWVRFYENWPQSFWVPGGPDLAAAMVANAILEGEGGVPVVLHSSAACPAPPRAITRPGPFGGDVEFAVASYLVVATPGTDFLSHTWGSLARAQGVPKCISGLGRGGEGWCTWALALSTVGGGGGGGIQAGFGTRGGVRWACLE
jgi:hypothetical protein